MSSSAGIDASTGMPALAANAFVTGSVSAATPSLFQHDTEFQNAYSASLAAGNIMTVTVQSASLSTPDLEAVRAFKVSGSTILGYFPQYTTTANNGSTITFVVSASAAPATLGIAYEKQPTATTRGDFEDAASVLANNQTSATQLNIPEINLELRSEAIVAKTRKLKAIWTPELAQDLNAYHSIDAEAELTSMLSDYISLEIDLEILDMLKANALTTDYWSATIGEEYLNNGATGQGAWGSSVPSGASTYYTKNTWYQTLGVKINKVSNKIHQLTLRGGANFLVASPDVCTILESIPGFVVNADKDALQFAAGVTAIGSMSNRYTVYKNPYMTSNEILLGFRGNNFLETGAVYAPYVPLIMTPLVYDPNTFTPRKGIMTRYAKKMVNNRFFGRIIVDGVRTFDLNELR